MLVSDALERVEIAVDDGIIRKVVIEHVKNCFTTIADHIFWAKLLRMSIFAGYSCGG